MARDQWGFPSLQREQLKEGAEVAILGAWYPSDLSRAPSGTIKAWKESRFGGVFVDVERRASHVQLCGRGPSYCEK
jgi:hypothetical protein